MKLQAWRKTAGAVTFDRYSREMQAVQALGLVFTLVGCVAQQETEPHTVRIDMPVAVPY